MAAKNATWVDRANDHPRQDHYQETCPAILADGSRTDKTRATLAALLAIKGYSLHELAGGSFLASKWNCTKHLPSLYAVQAFARQVGAV